MNHLLDTPVRKAAVGSILAVLVLPYLTQSTSMSIEILIFAVVVLGSNLLLGYAGLMSFAQGAFLGLGAYVAGLLRVHHDAGLATALIVPAVAAAAAAALVGWISIRRHGIYFVMLTLAFAQLFYFLAYAFPGITGGENGLQNVTRPVPGIADLRWSIKSNQSFYILCSLIFIGGCITFARMLDSPFGRVLVAIRENENRARAVGYDVRVFKIVAFAMAGALAGLAGALQALFLGLASISNVDILMSQEILMMSIIGGANSLAGALIGSAFFTIVSSVLSAWWPRWLLILGLLLIVMVLYMPGGIVGALRLAAQRWQGWRARLTPRSAQS